MSIKHARSWLNFMMGCSWKEDTKEIIGIINVFCQELEKPDLPESQSDEMNNYNSKLKKLLPEDGIPLRKDYQYIQDELKEAVKKAVAYVVQPLGWTKSQDIFMNESRERAKRYL